MSIEEKQAVLRVFEHTLGLKHRVATDLLGSGANAGSTGHPSERQKSLIAAARDCLDTAPQP